MLPGPGLRDLRSAGCALRHVLPRSLFVGVHALVAAILHAAHARVRHAGLELTSARLTKMRGRGLRLVRRLRLRRVAAIVVVRRLLLVLRPHGLVGLVVAVAPGCSLADASTGRGA